MDNFEEKKWFVYLGDHHEGPFSAVEIQEKMANGAVSSTHYLWTEGMDDWKPMPEVSFFSALMTTQKSIPIPQELPSLEENEPPRPRSRKSWRLIFFMILLMGCGLGFAALQGYLDPLRSDPTITALVKTASDAVQPLLLQLTEKYPTLSRWVSPIPIFEDISAAEYEELRTAASTPLDPEGPKIAFAVSNRELATPTVYVASNLPDGAVIQIHLEGVPDTLVSQLSAYTTTQVVIQKKWGKSQPIQLLEGQPLPRGQYDVYGLEAEKQPAEVASLLSKLQPVGSKLPSWAPSTFKLFATRSSFLGGLKDSTYAERLQEFHEKLQKKASDELSEIQQFVTTLESELGTTLSKFKTLYKPGKYNPAKKKEWDEFHLEWIKFQNQMSTTFEKWNPQTLESSFFYSKLYQLIQQSQQSLEKVHKSQNSYFNNEISDFRSYEIQLGEASSVAESSIASLKAKVEQASKIPPTPNGMPRKDGL